MKNNSVQALACMAVVTLMASAISSTALAQQPVNVKAGSGKNIEVSIGGKPFTTFMYPDTLEKPVLYPLHAANGTVVTRGFPLNPKPGDPTDHPHHIGLWFNYENLNGLDFWNNSYAIPAAKKNQYGWIHTDKITETKSGKTGVLAYQANWTNQAGKVLVQESTRFEFSGDANRRIIDRYTTLTADTLAVFTDAKDGLLGFRLAHELQMPTTKDESFTDSKGIVTVVKGGTDKVPTGNYLTSAGKTGDAAWSTRAEWCKIDGKMGADSITVAIIDHPKNVNYPTFWHARGYGLFAANPLGEHVFTNGKSRKDFTLQKGESVTFKYRIVIQNGKTALGEAEMDKLATGFAAK
ncbi:DUF6807 domain-containing protein [Mucilaginibacter pedocola]|uniref:Methane oxygenase PmoA n=1 Tax=Mucilaginibacter pedocola TaxID=1792845 RepID=A0A1S9PHI8_9SPHI|nr:PmoA family protein [Mucilaginibacter pedocola]OOQ60028.1 hypothetical protein BC343_27250 [Mucilaginibacter pedocola]